MSDAIDTTVTVRNANNFRELLTGETRPDVRGKLLDLLATEIAKLPEAAQRVELIKTVRHLAN